MADAITILALIALALTGAALVSLVVFYRRWEHGRDWYIAFAVLLLAIAAGALAVLLRETSPTAANGLVIAQLALLPICFWRLWSHWARVRHAGYARKPE